MSSFIKKSIIFSVLLIVAVLVINRFMSVTHNFVISKEKYFPVIRWDEFYRQDRNSINMIILGSSHAYRSYDSSFYDKIERVNSFNMGSSAQTIIDSYYVLKEVLNYQKAKYLILDLYWRAFNDYDQYFGTSCILDGIKAPVKYELMSDVLSIGERAEYCIPAIRFRKKLIDNIKILLGKDITAGSKDIYSEKGYVYNESVITPDYIKNMKEEALNIDALGNKSMIYFNKILKLCKENSIKIALSASPLMKSYMKTKIIGYDNLSKEIERKSGFKFYDFNRASLLKNFSDDEFMDDNHLNRKGAEKFNRLLILMLKKDNFF